VAEQNKAPGFMPGAFFLGRVRLSSCVAGGAWQGSLPATLRQLEH
jgi:hypothetical protein